jgi:hypothetical protein
MWNIDSPELDPNFLGSLLPERILFEYEGPRTYVCRNAIGELLFAHQCGEEPEVWRYAIVPFSDSLLHSLENGRLDLRSALQQPWLWIVDIGLSRLPIRCFRANIANIPDSCLPRAGVMLYPDDDPLLEIRYVGAGIDIASAGLAFLADSLSRLGGALDDLIGHVLPVASKLKASEFPVLLQGGSVRILILPPPRNAMDSKPDYTRVTQILAKSLRFAGTNVPGTLTETEELLAQRVALALTPPDNDRVQATHISGSLILPAASEILFRKNDRVRIRKVVQSLDARLSQSRRQSSLPAKISDTLALREAESFWIDAGKMNGTYRNWLEFPDRLAEFFRPEDWKADVLMQVPTGKKFVSEMRRRGKKYGQYAPMSRIELPTPTESGLTYANNYVRLTRLTRGDLPVYMLETAAPESKVAAQWMKHSELEGRISRMGGHRGRRFGFW